MLHVHAPAGLSSFVSLQRESARARERARVYWQLRAAKVGITTRSYPHTHSIFSSSRASTQCRVANLGDDYLDCSTDPNRPLNRHLSGRAGRRGKPAQSLNSHTYTNTQPLLPCLLPSAKTYNTLRTTTNPYEATISVKPATGPAPIDMAGKPKSRSEPDAKLLVIGTSGLSPKP
jgi:hypothetical protein